MTSESNRIGKMGVNYIEGVLTRWGWGYQSISQENDDGFDGLIYIRSKRFEAKDKENRSKQSWEFTGGLIHVQVKSGDTYISSRNKDEIRIKIKTSMKRRKYGLDRLFHAYLYLFFGIIMKLSIPTGLILNLN
ncbi:DUF4365 domain-containing protein [Escherichia coli]